MAEAYRDISLGLSDIVMHFLCAKPLPFEDRGIDCYITHHEALQYQSQGSDYALPCTHISLPEISDAHYVFLTRQCKLPLIFRARVH